MASLRRIPGRQVWIACFTGPDGQRYQRSTGTRDEREARKIADELEAFSRGQHTSDQVRRIVYDLHEKYTGERLSDTTVREFFSRFLSARKNELAPSTFSRYANVSDRFLEAIGLKADGPIVRVTKSDIASYRDNLAANFKTSTANSHLKVVRVFFRQAKRDGLIPDNIAADVSVLKVRDTDIQRQPFTIDQIRTILASVDGELRGIILFGYYSGLRLKDICLLTWEHVDLEKCELNCPTAKTRRRKIIPIAEPLQDWLLTLPAADNARSPVFPQAYKSVTQSSSKSAVTISNRFSKLLSQLGFRDNQNHESRGIGRSSRRQVNSLTFHSLRHSLTSHLKEAGISEALAMEIVGHDTAEMSRHYTKIDRATIKNALNSLPDVRT